MRTTASSTNTRSSSPTTSRSSSTANAPATNPRSFHATDLCWSDNDPRDACAHELDARGRKREAADRHRWPRLHDHDEQEDGGGRDLRHHAPRSRLNSRLPSNGSRRRQEDERRRHRHDEMDREVEEGDVSIRVRPPPIDHARRPQGHMTFIGTRLENKTALVTGATSNIGRAIAKMFAAEGAHVVVSGRNHERGIEVVDEVRAAAGHADFVAVDLDGSVRASNDLAVEATRVLGGRIDILVNNAGIYPGSTTATTDESSFDQVYSVNVKAPFFLTAAIAPGMAERGEGAIINLSTWIDRLGIP